MLLIAVGDAPWPKTGRPRRIGPSLVLGLSIAPPGWATSAGFGFGAAPSTLPCGESLPHGSGPLALVLVSDNRESLCDRFSPLAPSPVAAGYVFASMDALSNGQDQAGVVAQAKPRSGTGRAIGDGLACCVGQIEATPSDCFATCLQGVSVLPGQLKAGAQVTVTRVGQVPPRRAPCWHWIGRTQAALGSRQIRCFAQ